MGYESKKSATKVSSTDMIYEFRLEFAKTSSESITINII